MLLRSASTPILNSWAPLSKEPGLETDLGPPIQRARSITHLPPVVSLTASSKSASPCEESALVSSKKMTRALSETELRDLSRPPAAPKRKPLVKRPNRKRSSSIALEEGKEERGSDRSSASIGQLFSSSGLDELLEGNEDCCVVGASVKEKTSPGLFLSDGFEGIGGDGICGGGRGGGGGDGDDDDGSGFSDSNNGNGSPDAYFQKVIEANPGNGLLLVNYARFLKEVCGDLVKAEEYCGRAILANPGDGDALSLYADLTWRMHKDTDRADSYFNQAIKAAPGDSHVMASYALFLWESGEEDEGEDGVEDEGNSGPSFFQETAPHHPLAAAS